MLSQHFIRLARAHRAALLLAVLGSLAASPFAAAQQVSSSPSSFIVFLRAERIGNEEIVVTRTAEGWTIGSAGRIGPPIDLEARQVIVRYTADWKPIELRIDASVRGQLVKVQTSVSGQSATTTVTQGDATNTRTDPIPEDAILMPNPFFGPYEALAQRLRTAALGTFLQGYVGGAAFQIEVGQSSDETIQTAADIVRAHRTAVKIQAPGAPLDMEVWADPAGHLLRLSVPAQNLEVVREDLASVAARRVTAARPNDELVRIPANGFDLAGTLSKPADPGKTPLPAAILVSGSGPQDRDETVFGIPIFGQLAGGLADAGFMVLRYDKRGVGQSGGRIESATMSDYADDLGAALKFMNSRKDVNRRFVAVIGHSEGGSVAMITAGKDRRLTALGLVATIGVTGAELNMTQVTHAMDRSKRPAAERQSTIELQKKIQTAVLTGKGWEDVPAPLRKQADVPWFKSFLSFDPAQVMSRIRQPILIVHGLLDTQVDPANADRLEQMARARKNGGPVSVVKVEGVNHLLVPAVTGEVDEYASLKDKTVSPNVISAIANWLKNTASAVR
jgi:pimeloyl-ACP methyl ester carboxylesterase